MRWIFLLVMAWGALTLVPAGAQTSTLPAGYRPRPAGSITFTRDIAPIVFANCTACHRPGQIGPFPLIDYQDLAKRSKLIAELVGKRLMPPWPPEPGYGEFENERRLSTDQVGLIQQWVAEGFPEGKPGDLPPKPVWKDEWELGPPDLILKPSEAYELPADGRDVYRNLVIPIPLTNAHYIRAVEFHPSNRAVHHVFMFLDKTTQSRQRDARDPGPGFGGMDLPPTAAMPQGHFLTWQPGRRAYKVRDGFAWTLPAGADFVIQIHANPTGKPEFLQPEIGFYFTTQPPTNSLYKIGLMSTAIDIPAGQSNYVVEDSYTLPVDATVYAVNPHAHYLGKELQGYATLPDGSRKWLLRINNWDFYWQGDYRLKEPLALPKGTVLTMHYLYDNSENNPRNPSHPPKRVRSGVQATDEMAEFWIQVSPRPADLPVLAIDFQKKAIKNVIESHLRRLEIDPDDAGAHSQLGVIRLVQGATNEAILHFEAALKSDSNSEDPHYYLGVIYRAQGRRADAVRELEMVVKLNPNAGKAYGTLGFIAAEDGRKEEAIRFFERALAINSDDTLARQALDQLHRNK